MVKCLKCGEDFTPQKGLVNYCSLKCRNSRIQTKEINLQRSNTAKGLVILEKVKSKTLCDYGCGQVAKFLLKNRKFCCEISSNKCPEQKRKNKEGCLNAYRKNTTLLRGFQIKDSRSEEWRKKSQESRKLNIMSKPFKERSIEQKKKQILEEQNGKCLSCSIDSWLEKKISLELHHVDGNHSNDERENLQLLCPNCHSLTNNYCNKGKGNVKKVTDEMIIEKG